MAAARGSGPRLGGGGGRAGRGRQRGAVLAGAGTRCTRAATVPKGGRRCGFRLYPRRFLGLTRSRGWRLQWCRRCRLSSHVEYVHVCSSRRYSKALILENNTENEILPSGEWMWGQASRLALRLRSKHADAQFDWVSSLGEAQAALRRPQQQMKNSRQAGKDGTRRRAEAAPPGQWVCT